MKKIMKEKNQVVPDEVLSKEFLSQFKTEADVSKFLKQLHAQVLEKMLEGEMDAHLGYVDNPCRGLLRKNGRKGQEQKSGKKNGSFHLPCNTHGRQANLSGGKGKSLSQRPAKHLQGLGGQLQLPHQEPDDEQASQRIIQGVMPPAAGKQSIHGGG